MELNGQEQNGKKGESKNKKSGKAIRWLILAVVLLLAGGMAYYYYLGGSQDYFATDNAKVTAKMYYITPNISGELLEWRAKEGQKVAKNEILGRQSVLPYITSPIDGTVVRNNAAEGQIVSPATQLAVIADTGDMYIGVNVEETDIMKINVGQTVDVKIDAYPGRTFPGVVAEIDQTTQTYFSNPTSFSTSGTYTKVTQLIPVKVFIENKENLPLTFGMNATVKIHLKDKMSSNIVVTGDAPGLAAKPALDYSSFIEAGKQMDVSPNVSGKVQSIKVEVGQKVTKGDVLFSLDSIDAEMQIKQAEAGIVPAQIAYNDADASYARLQILYEEGAIAKAELDNANTRLETTKAQMESAKIALQMAQKKLKDYTVTAPISGEVAAKHIEIGGMVSPQTAAITLINTQDVLLHVNVTETNISRVKIGAKAQIKVQAINAAAEGTVVNIAPASDPKTGMFPVEIRMNNPGGKFKPGMITDVKLLIE